MITKGIPATGTERIAVGGDPASGRAGRRAEVVEFSTHVRGLRVTCRWDGLELTGDGALLDRLRRSGALPSPGDRPAAVARSVRAAVPAPVSIHVVGPARAGLSLR